MRPTIFVLFAIAAFLSFDEAHAFVGLAGVESSKTTRVVLSMVQDGNPPPFPTSGLTNNRDGNDSHGVATNTEESTGQANTRFSAFAPDQSLEATDFRAQLKENMKKEMERRRAEEPNRGNQPAKTYLDSL